MNKWFCSDWHLGETRLDIMGRPFKNTDEMTNVLVENHNSLVAKKDLVFFGGDSVYAKADPKYLDEIARFNGRKILFRGNHDRNYDDKTLLKYFEEIIPEGHGMPITIDGIPCWITHYPTQGREDRFNIVGHIHAIWKCQLNMLNIGVDVHHFYPINEDKISFYYKAICDFYDQDAWVAYNKINSGFVGTRGKEGTYYGT